MQRQHMNFGNALHPAAGNDRDAHRARQIDRRLDIAAFQQPVAPDIGEQQSRHARILEAARHVDHFDGRDIGPALGGDEAVARIDRDDDATGEIARGRADQLGIFQRSGADHHARDAEIEPALDPRAVANAAAQLHMAGEALDDRAHGLAIDRFAGERAVEIDDVEMLRARFGKQHRLRGGIVTIDGRAVHIALGQADDLAALQIDRGENDKAHGFQLKNRVRRSSP